MSLSFELPSFRTLTGVLLAGVLLAACTGSELVSFDGGGTSAGDAGVQGSGAAGTGAGSSAGSAGTTGAAGHITTGAAGTGAAGTGLAGAGAGTAGHGGTTGAAGTGTVTGAAGTGSTGAAGTSGGAAGTTGTAGTSGAAGTGGQQWVYSGIGGIENVLINNCGGCHFMAAGVTIQGGFSFSYANVTGVITSGNKACPNLDTSKRRVVPGKPDNSLLYIKISQDKPAAGCGGHMPYQGQRLTDNVIGWIRDWILQGAKP